VVSQATPENAAQVIRKGAGCHDPDDDQHHPGNQEKHSKNPGGAHRVSLLKMSDLTRSSHIVPRKNVSIMPAAKTPMIKYIVILAPFSVLQKF
jgi:hypothetical protein